MNRFDILYESYLGYAAVLFCISFGFFFLRKSSRDITGPEFWTAGYFLNSVGFLFWAFRAAYDNQLFFVVGDFIHMIGFLILVYGAFRFAGKKVQKRHVYALCGVAVLWLVAIVLMLCYSDLFVFLLMVSRSVLFCWAGYTVLTSIPKDYKAGRVLAGWALMGWGVYIILFPLFFLTLTLLPLAFGFLTGFHLLAGLGMVILVLERIRIRAEDSEKHIKHLEGLIPICANCKKIRDDHDNWQELESYIQERSDAEFSHGICPECSEKIYGDQPWFKKMKEKKRV